MTTEDSNNKQVGRQKQSKWLIAIGFIAVLGVIFFAMLTVKETRYVQDDSIQRSREQYYRMGSRKQIRYRVFNAIDDLT